MACIDGVPPFSVFDAELRRRLWWLISLLEMHSSFDRASDPIITYGTYNARMPLNINDSDLDLDTKNALEDRNEFTDLTFSLICHEVLDAERKLNFVPPRATNKTIDDSTDWWTSRKDLAAACENRLPTRFLRHCDYNIPK